MQSARAKASESQSAHAPRYLIAQLRRAARAHLRGRPHSLTLSDAITTTTLTINQSHFSGTRKHTLAMLHDWHYASTHKRQQQQIACVRACKFALSSYCCRATRQSATSACFLSRLAASGPMHTSSRSRFKWSASVIQLIMCRHNKHM